MIREVLATMNLGFLSFGLLVGFLIAFSFACVWIFRRSGKAKYEYIQSLPFSSEDFCD